MVYLENPGSSWDIWSVPGRVSSASAAAPEQRIASSRNEGKPAYSPDGRRIAFESNRSGAPNIWVCDSDGSDPVQFTSFDALTGTPRWSADSRRLVFDSAAGGDWNVYVVDASGGTPRKLTEHPGYDFVASWSRDDRFLSLQLHEGAPARSGKSRWRRAATQVTRRGGFYALESWDGRHVYFIRSWDRPSIWRMPAEGGEATEIVAGPIQSAFDWTLSRNGLYYAIRPRPGVYTIQFLAFDSGQATELFRDESALASTRLGGLPRREDAPLRRRPAAAGRADAGGELPLRSW